MLRREIPQERLARALTDATGLSASEVVARRTRYGANHVVPPGAGWGWEILRDTAADPMIWFLVGVSILYLTLGEVLEGMTLLVAVAPLVLMDVFLHRRTRASTAGLESRLTAEATVLRDGVESEVPASDLVPGDLVRVDAGMPFPADGVILAGSDLQADESALTGESWPVRKRPLLASAAGDLQAIVGDESWGLAGTHLLTGRLHMRVVFTAGETLYGEIVRSALLGAHVRTPLQVAIGNLVGILVAAASVLCVTLALVRFRQGFGLLDALVSALTLAVAALPEEFPVVFTVFLGVGVHRLARAQALVRRAVCVENIGRVTTICSDKTGTLTDGRFSLTHLLPMGSSTEDWLLEKAAGAAAADSHDPIDLAIRAEAMRRSVLPSGPVRAAFRFTEERRRETAVIESLPGQLVAITKGSPEVVLAMCATDEAENGPVRDWIARFASEGHKVLACAWREIPEEGWAGGEPDRGFHLAGVLAFEDPVRDGVTPAVAACRAAGIRVVMITGDHPATALAVAKEIGLGGGEPHVVAADALLAESCELTPAALAGVDAVARAVPAQKLALVRAFQAAGEIVAVTGDGVNDVPALQAADVGIAIGERATRSAMEVASIVLLDANFRTIVRAIGEGQQLFRNLQLGFLYLLVIHLPLVLTAALIPLAGFPVLYLPIHIVWLELVIHPSAMLAFQAPAPAGQLTPAHRGSELRFFVWREWLCVALAGLFLTLAVGAGFVRGVDWLGDVEHGRAVALAILTLASASLTIGLGGRATLAGRVLPLATVGLSFLLIQVPGLARLLHLRPLHVDDWAIATAAALVTGAIAAVGRPR